MNKVLRFLGMAWTTPVVRTGVQAAAVVLTGAGLGWVDIDVWRLAGMSAGASIFAYVQAEARQK